MKIKRLWNTNIVTAREETVMTKLTEGRKVRALKDHEGGIYVAGMEGWVVTPNTLTSRLLEQMHGGVWVHFPGVISNVTGEPLMQGHGYLISPEDLEDLGEHVGEDVRTQPDPMEEERARARMWGEEDDDDDEDEDLGDLGTGLDDFFTALFGPMRERDVTVDRDGSVEDTQEPTPILEDPQLDEMDRGAEMVGRLFTSYLNNGFTRGEAFELIKLSVGGAK